MKTFHDYRAVVDTVDLHLLSDEVLIKQCFAPLIDAYKQIAAQNGDAAGMYADFTDGQKALFAVRTFLDHAVTGTEEFHWRCLLFRTYPQRFLGMKGGIALFGDTAMAEIVDDIGRVIQEVKVEEGTMITAEDANSLLRNGSAYEAAIIDLESRLLAALSYTYSLIAAFIRNRADDFIRTNN